MGEVYLAENIEMGKTYALKLLPTELAEDPQFRERFRREARVMADLEHPNVVRVHDIREGAVLSHGAIVSGTAGEARQ